MPQATTVPQTTMVITEMATTTPPRKSLQSPWWPLVCVEILHVTVSPTPTKSGVTTEEDSKAGLSTGAIIGIAVGVGGGVIVVAIVIVVIIIIAV